MGLKKRDGPLEVDLEVYMQSPLNVCSPCVILYNLYNVLLIQLRTTCQGWYHPVVWALPHQSLMEKMYHSLLQVYLMGSFTQEELRFLLQMTALCQADKNICHKTRLGRWRDKVKA